MGPYWKFRGLLVFEKEGRNLAWRKPACELDLRGRRERTAVRLFDLYLNEGAGVWIRFPLKKHYRAATGDARCIQYNKLNHGRTNWLKELTRF